MRNVAAMLTHLRVQDGMQAWQAGGGGATAHPSCSLIAQPPPEQRLTSPLLAQRYLLFTATAVFPQ
jgi:hypothetical protein